MTIIMAIIFHICAECRTETNCAGGFESFRRFRLTLLSGSHDFLNAYQSCLPTVVCIFLSLEQVGLKNGGRYY